MIGDYHSGLMIPLLNSGGIGLRVCSIIWESIVWIGKLFSQTFPMNENKRKCVIHRDTDKISSLLGIIKFGLKY